MISVAVVVVVCSLALFFLVLIFCSKNGEFTSRNSFCLETDHLKDTRSREQCAGKLSKVNLGVENRGKNRTFRLFQHSLLLLVWSNMAPWLWEQHFPVGEVAVHFQIDWGTRASWRNQGTCPSLQSFLKYLKRNLVLFKISVLLFLQSLEKTHFPAQSGVRKQKD